ncbi:metal ABC transporter ATP-binding protein [Georgenia deserti]|uniref:Metal ABC transporter ATP-binding protein n=1 Tax=Georgenia deserti TaxID=2093781 RepID=A0ABW4L7W1_9MICO
MADSSGPPAAPSSARIRAEALGVSFGAAPVLRGIDLTVSDGEAVALLGANGSGKSTLVKAIVGLAPITRGRVLLDGRDVVTQRRRIDFDRIGYVPQRLTAASGVPATALEVVASGLLSRGRLRIGRAGRERALAALDQVGLADRAGESVQIFSGGQQQRVLIARALVREPSLLILDEPLAGIDAASKESLAATVADLRARETTLLVVLHEPAELGPLIDRAVVLRHGRVVHDGPMPRPAPGHDAPDHDHEHPHAGATGPTVHVPDLSVGLPAEEEMR